MMYIDRILLKYCMVPAQALNLETRLWYPPRKIQIEGDSLVYSWHKNIGRAIRPRAEMLEEFVRLGDEPDDRIAHYARRWGTMGVCACRLPLSHNPHRSWTGAQPGCSPLGMYDEQRPDGLGWEPLDLWRKWSRDAAAILRIIACLKEGQLPEIANWRQIYSAASTPNVPWWRRGVEAESMMVGHVVNEWLGIGDVRPRVHWHDEESIPAKLWTHVGGLFGALAYQLAISLSSTRAVAVCSDCGFGYMPSRAPSPNRRNFCGECRDRGRDQNAASKDFRSRKKQAQRLLRQGLSPAVVAERVGSRLKTVQKWTAGPKSKPKVA